MVSRTDRKLGSCISAHRKVYATVYSLGVDKLSRNFTAEEWKQLTDNLDLVRKECGSEKARISSEEYNNNTAKTIKKADREALEQKISRLESPLNKIRNADFNLAPTIERIKLQEEVIGLTDEKEIKKIVKDRIAG